MSDNNRELVEPRNITMYPTHWATVDAYAKDMGYPSTSAALRRIIDEWLDLRTRQLVDATTPYTAEGEPAI